MWGVRIKKSFYKAVLRSIPVILNACSVYGSLCFDLPATTSPLLRCLGYSEYFVRRFWAVFDELSNLRIPLYTLRNTSFTLHIVHRKEGIPHIEGECIPIEDIVCFTHKLRCVRSPHTHALYLYIEGSYSGRIFVRTNVLRVLRVMNVWREQAPYQFIKLLDDFLDGTAGVDDLLRFVFDTLIDNKRVMSLILPKLPLSTEELLKLSPLLRIMRIPRT